MSGIIGKVNYRDGRIFTTYSLPVFDLDDVERRAHDWLNNALFLNVPDSKRYFHLDDIKGSWSFGFNPSEEEFEAVQTIVSYWQTQTRPRYQPSPLDVINPTVYASLYENILGLRIWLKNNIGNFGWCTVFTDGEWILANTASQIYLRTMDVWIQAIVQSEASVTRNSGGMHPKRCFRFYNPCKRCSLVKPDFPSSYQVEITNVAFGEYLSSEIAYYKNALLLSMEELPVIVVRTANRAFNDGLIS